MFYCIGSYNEPPGSRQSGFLEFRAILDAMNPWNIVKGFARRIRWPFIGRRSRESGPSYNANAEDAVLISNLLKLLIRDMAVFQLQTTFVEVSLGCLAIKSIPLERKKQVWSQRQYLISNGCLVEQSWSPSKSHEIHVTHDRVRGSLRGALYPEPNSDGPVDPPVTSHESHLDPVNIPATTRYPPELLWTLWQRKRPPEN